MARRMLILGCGYTGKAVALLMQAAGWQVSGTARGQGSLAGLEAAGIEAVEFSGASNPALEAALSAADAILGSIPADPAGDPALRALGGVIAADPPAWTGYLSTTAVYGDRAGRWAWETDPPLPSSPRAGARMLAESQWLALPNPAHIFRLPGIYGPGRSQLDRLRAGENRSVDKPGQVFSRCHRDDIAAGVAAAIARPHPGTIFNLCDDAPCPALEVNRFAAGLLGLPDPPLVPFETAELSEMARQFYADSKRVSNARAKAMLGWRPAYPTYREGLSALFTSAY